VYRPLHEEGNNTLEAMNMGLKANEDGDILKVVINISQARPEASVALENIKMSLNAAVSPPVARTTADI